MRRAGRATSSASRSGTATKEGDPDAWRAAAEHARELGASHLSIQTYATEPISPAEHIERVGLIADAVVAPTA